jgi:hypothetical protein
MLLAALHRLLLPAYPNGSCLAESIGCDKPTTIESPLPLVSTAKTRQQAIDVLTLQVLQRLLSQRLWVVLTA